ncbi:MAG: response regulator [Ktedonobacteraceae bacterium]
MPPFILIVEDHQNLREMLTAALTLHGYRIAQAADAREALLLLWQRASTGHAPDLILLDLEMPDGVQFLEHLQGPWTIWPRPLLVLMTATGAAVSLPYPLLRKPFQIKDILSVLHQLLSDSGKASGKVESQ